MKEEKYIIPIIVTGLIFSQDLHQISDEESVNILFHFPEPHQEESFLPDYNGLSREKNTASETGFSTVLTFPMDYSIW